MSYLFPEYGRPEEEVMEDLRACAARLGKYQDHRILGFPGTVPQLIALQAQMLFSELHANNIQTHTRKGTISAKSAFGAAYELEREVIYMLGDLLGGDSIAPIDQVIDGYLTSGGTEANFMGLWIGRNKLLHNHNVGQRGILSGRIRVIAPLSAHYSIRKACDILGLGEGSWLPCSKSDCETLSALRSEGERDDTVTLLDHQFQPNPDGSGLVFVGLDERCRMDISDVEAKIDEAVDKGITKFIIAATAGTTMTGAFDPVEELGNLVWSKGQKVPGLECYIHVDAAFGGLVAPFLQADRDQLKFDFSLLCGEGATKRGIVDSIAVDPHKMGMVPYPAGAFLCRKDHQDYVQRAVAYISDHNDDTFLGSRPSSAAAACWAVFSHLGRKGYEGIKGFEEIIDSCMKLTRYLEGVLSGIHGVKVIPPKPTINILSAEFDPQIYDPRRLRQIAARYRVVPELFMRDVTACPQRVYRFTLMPHVREATIDSFISDLSEALIRPTS